MSHPSVAAPPTRHMAPLLGLDSFSSSSRLLFDYFSPEASRRPSQLDGRTFEVPFLFCINNNEDFLSLFFCLECVVVIKVIQNTCNVIKMLFFKIFISNWPQYIYLSNTLQYDIKRYILIKESQSWIIILHNHKLATYQLEVPLFFRRRK